MNDNITRYIINAVCKTHVWDYMNLHTLSPAYIWYSHTSVISNSSMTSNWNDTITLSYWGFGQSINTLRPRQNGRHFADNIFKCIFFNENVWILIKISLEFVPKGPINNMPALVPIMTWHWPGDKPLSEPMIVSLLMHICVTRSQWVYAQTHKFKVFPVFPK